MAINTIVLGEWIMSKIIIKFLLDFLEGIVGTLTNYSLLILAEQPFAIEEGLKRLGVAQFDNIFNMFVSIGITLIVVKFLKKGFDMYILWTDGDADADPLQLVINFFRAMIIALTFTFLFTWFTDIVLDITDDILKSIGLFKNINESQFQNWFTTINNLDRLLVSTVIGYVIFFIMYIILYIKLIAIGFQMLILRIGLPLACVGLMDADKGVFKTYIQKFFQVSITIIVQVTMMKLALSLIIAGHTIWGLAGVYFAITTPNFIREFLIFSSGGGITNNLYSTARLAQMARQMIK